LGTPTDHLNEALQSSRGAFERRHWAQAYEGFSAARDHSELSVEDLFALGNAAWWLGYVDESLSINEELYRRYLNGDRPREAAMAAMEVAVNLFLRGDLTIASGWISRTRRLLQDQPEGVEHAYVLYLTEVEGPLGGISAMEEADFQTMVSSARAVQEAGRRHNDPNLVTAGVLGEGRALVKKGRVAEGMRLLDEVMVSLLTDDLLPEWAGNFYCHLMAAAQEVADLRRAVDWMEATTKWLESLPPAVLFTGICRIHRSQVLQLKGAWQQAEMEAVRVCEDLAVMHVRAAAEGHYQVGELRRLRGDLEGAERAYQRAHEMGRDPHPGLALVLLGRGRVDAATASIRNSLVAEPSDRLVRARLCSALVEIAVASGDLELARDACAEIEKTASVFGSSGLEASALHARALVAFAEASPDEALPILRAVLKRWKEFDAPYESACIGLLLAETYSALQDADAVELELNACAAIFERLGATVEAGKVRALRAKPRLPDGLTRREVEVLSLVAAGGTNRAVAESLFISERTVERHLANIFIKAGVSSRTEAAAYAFKQDLAAPTRT
jgi:DNA-binding NarL/FixJ family response regulator